MTIVLLFLSSKFPFFFFCLQEKELKDILWGCHQLAQYWTPNVQLYNALLDTFYQGIIKKEERVLLIELLSNHKITCSQHLELLTSMEKM